MEAHVCTVESGKAQRERQLGRQRPLFLLITTPQMLPGNWGQGVDGGGSRPDLHGDSNPPQHSGAQVGQLPRTATSPGRDVGGRKTLPS